MEFWTTELYAVLIIAGIGLILLAFLTAWLYTSKGTVFIRRGKWLPSFSGGEEKLSSRHRTYGRRDKLFPLLAVMLAIAGAIGILYFAQDLWERPLFVADYDLNLMFVFAVFASFMMFITFSIAGLNYWAKQRMEVKR